MTQTNLPQRQSAQVMAIFAVGLIGFLALVALVLDGSTIYVQRRTAQNAADAAALAGTRKLMLTTTSPSNAVADTVCTYLQANAFGPLPTASAYLVDIHGQPLRTIDVADCSASHSPTDLTDAAGVHVDASISFRTYLIGTVGRALRLGPIDSLTAAASATSRVWNYAIDTDDLAPWAACGQHAPKDTSGHLIDLFVPGTTTIDPALYGTAQVILEDAKINAGNAGWLADYPPPTCPDAPGSSWKGKVDLPDGDLIVPMAAGTGVPTTSGNGTADEACAATQQAFGPCYLFVPVTDDHNPSGKAHIVTFACMKMLGDGTGNPKWAGLIVDPVNCPTTPYKTAWAWGAAGSTANTRVALTS